LGVTVIALVSGGAASQLAGTALRGDERMYDPILLLFDGGGEEKVA
jgi:hypothetical protein